MKLWFNLFTPDPQALLDFYQALLGLPEAVASRSPIYRALETADFQLGFNARPAYDLLGLTDRAPPPLSVAPVTAYCTFMLDTPEAVSRAAEHVTSLGGSLIKPPYPTYYGQWQAVLADPQHNVFRLSAQGLPEGVPQPAFPLPD